MKEFYLRILKEAEPYNGRNLHMLNMSTLRQQCRTAYWNYTNEACEVNAKGGFRHKNNMLRFLREVLPVPGTDAGSEDLKVLMDEAVLSYLNTEESFLSEPQLIQLGTKVREMVAGKDYAVSRKLSFKPHLDLHKGLTSFVMQTDLFVIDDNSTTACRIIQSEGDPSQNNLYEALLTLLMQHKIFHPDKACYTTMYGAYIPIKTKEYSLLKSDLKELPEITVNRIINHLFSLTPLCDSCRYTNCEERQK